MTDPLDTLVAPTWERLERLLMDRATPGARTELIDAQIWEIFGRDYTCMVTDLCGLARAGNAFGATHVLQLLAQSKRLLYPVVAQHGGSVSLIEEDSLVVLFRRASNAVRCALEMEARCREHNEKRLEEEQLLFCAAVGVGQFVEVPGQGVWGSELVAARHLARQVAQAGDVLLTEGARGAVGEAGGLGNDVAFVELGVAAPGSEQSYRVQVNQRETAHGNG